MLPRWCHCPGSQARDTPFRKEPMITFTLEYILTANTCLEVNLPAGVEKVFRELTVFVIPDVGSLDREHGHRIEGQGGPSPGLGRGGCSGPSNKPRDGLKFDKGLHSATVCTSRTVCSSAAGCSLEQRRKTPIQHLVSRRSQMARELQEDVTRYA